MYQLKPAPPKMKLQEYIELYCSEKEEKYLIWFLHYYEPTLNAIVKEAVQRYAMEGHFADIKSACIMGMMKALEKYDPATDAPFVIYKTRIMWEEIHTYIRTMRTGYTVQSDDEYLLLRKTMAVFEKYGSKTDEESLLEIANEIERKPSTVMSLLQGGVRNLHQVEFYRQYDDEESSEDVTCDHSTEPYKMLMKIETEEALIDAFDLLDYREQSVVAAHLGFCKECWSTKNVRPQTFEGIAYDHTLSSVSTADTIYRKALAKMRKALEANGICTP